MDWGAWWATFHGVTRVGHDLVTKIPPPRVQGSLTPWKEKKDATPAGPKKCSISQSGASATMAHFTLCTDNVQASSEQDVALVAISPVNNRRPISLF